MNNKNISKQLSDLINTKKCVIILPSEAEWEKAARGGACVAGKFVAEISEMGGGRIRKQTKIVLKTPPKNSFPKILYNHFFIISCSFPHLLGTPYGRLQIKNIRKEAKRVKIMYTVS